MAKIARELQREQQKRWVADIEKAARLGFAARDDWWAQIDESEKDYWRGLVGKVRIMGPGIPSEGDHGPHIPASRDPIAAALSRDAVRMLLDFEWDRQIEEDAENGKLGWLDALAEKARKEHSEGRTTPL